MRPSHASWFDPDGVDDVEKRSLPEFFNGESATKTPEAYVHMRNFILSMYSEAPTVHLSVTECRRHLAADVGAVMRLHQFLEHWGLINYNAQGAPPASSAASDGVALDGSSLVPGSGAGLGSSTAALRTCASSGSGSVGGGRWTGHETLMLLEAVEAGGGVDASWEDIGSQIGRSAEDCIGHFLALPIAEAYHARLDGGSGGNGATSAAKVDAGVPNGTAAAAPPADPLLAQLALLAAATGGGGGEGDDGNGGAAKRQKRLSEAAEAAASPMRAAAASLIASVQARASHAIDDARTSLVAQLGGAVETQLKRVELKLGQLEEMACLLRREREQLERARHGVYAERLLLESRHAQQLAAPIPIAAVHLPPP